MSLNSERTICQSKLGQEGKHSGQWMAAMFGSAGDAVVCMDTEGLVVFMNPIAEKLTGWNTEDAFGREIVDVVSIVNKGIGEAVDCPITRVIEQENTGSLTSHTVLIRKDGKRVPIDYSANPINNDNEEVVGVVYVFRDIAARTQAEERLARSKEKYLELLNNMNDGFWVTDEVGTLTFANRALTEILGLESLQVLMGKNIGEFISAEHRDRTLKSFTRAVKNEEFPLVMEAPLINQKSGSTCYIEMKLSAVTSSGELIGTQAVIRDVTERKEAEERITEYRHHLEEMVRERTSELVETNRKLHNEIRERAHAEKQRMELEEKLRRSEKMESLGMLAGGVAHDLNNMLGPLVAYPELILLKLPDDSPVRKQVESIGRAASDAADVIQDLLMLARRGRCELKPLDINDVLAEFFESPCFEKIANDFPDLVINKQLDKTIPNIDGSFVHLSKIIMNLFLNACEATQAGGQITIKTSHAYLDKLFGGYDQIKSGDYVITQVCDTGRGIDPEDIKRIFEPYYSRKKMGSSGTGLGLSIVYGIIKDHNGYYDIKSEVGEGTEFTIYFPSTEKESRVDVVTAKMAIEGHERILVVDDSKEQREVSSELLSNLGYEVVIVNCGREAVKYLKDHEVDLVVLDMIMEENFDGLDTYVEIIKLHPGQKAVIVSGYSSTIRVRKMQELGAGQYVKKPFTLKTISRAVRETLDIKAE